METRREENLDDRSHLSRGPGLRALAAMTLAFSVAASLQVVVSPAIANHETNGMDPVVSTPEVWRGWVASEVVFQPSSYDWRYRGGWSVDTSRTSTDAIAEAFTHETFESLDDSYSSACNPMRSSVGGTTQGAEVMKAKVGLYAGTGETKGYGVPVAGEGFSVEMDYYGPNYLIHGLEQCNETIRPRQYAGDGHIGLGPPDAAAAPADLSAVPMKLAYRLMDWQYAGKADSTYSFQVCLSRSKLDTDMDGLPDDVDLAPNASASPRELGVPGGPELEILPPKIPGAPSGKRGVPTCPNTVPEEEPCDGLRRGEIEGRKPSYTSAALSTFPNHRAACEGIWAPHLDSGFIPQGIAHTDSGVWVAGYNPKTADRPAACGVYLMDPDTGQRSLGYRFTGAHLSEASRRAGFLEVRKCGHAGGVSILPDGRLLVADTDTLFVVNPSLFGGDPIQEVIALSPIGTDKPFKGSFLVDGEASADPSVATIWIGTYRKDSPNILRQFTIAEVLQDIYLEASDESRDIYSSLPKRSQGGAFTATGELVIASSASRCGKLTWLDASGQTLYARGFGPGVEEILFVGDRLWAGFEAGAKAYIGLDGAKFYPLIASFDPSKITEGPGTGKYCDAL